MPLKLVNKGEISFNFSGKMEVAKHVEATWDQTGYGVQFTDSFSKNAWPSISTDDAVVLSFPGMTQNALYTTMTTAIAAQYTAKQSWVGIFSPYSGDAADVEVIRSQKSGIFAGLSGVQK